MDLKLTNDQCPGASHADELPYLFKLVLKDNLNKVNLFR